MSLNVAIKDASSQRIGIYEGKKLCNSTICVEMFITIIHSSLCFSSGVQKRLTLSYPTSQHVFKSSYTGSCFIIPCVTSKYTCTTQRTALWIIKSSLYKCNSSVRFPRAHTRALGASVSSLFSRKNYIDLTSRNPPQEEVPRYHLTLQQSAVCTWPMVAEAKYDGWWQCNRDLVCDPCTSLCAVGNGTTSRKRIMGVIQPL